MKDMIVVGAGVIGTTITKTFRELGMDVTLVDAKREGAGTPPSGGHLKPSWFSGMTKDDYTPALDILENAWGLNETQFTLRPSKKTATVYRVDTDLITSFSSENRKVTRVFIDGKYPRIIYKDKWGYSEDECKYLVLCTGVWASLFPEFFEDNPIKRKQGISFRFPMQLHNGPFIQPWAPYKQIVAHQQTDSLVWAGDGSVILEDNWTPERTYQCKRRCAKALKTVMLQPRETRWGLRAYCSHTSKKDPCLLTQPGHKRVWIATGSGKSGTIAGGWVTHRLIASIT